MAVKVKKVILWKRELENRPGTLAEALKPFAEAKQNLQVVMGYGYPGERERAALELYPVSGKKGEEAALAAGLEAMTHTNCLLVEGDDQLGLAYNMSNNLSAAGINISFAIIQVVGRKFLGIFGFDTASDADRASVIIKAAGQTTSRKAVSRKKVRRVLVKATKKVAGKKKSVKKAAAKKTGVKKALTKKAAAKKTAAKKTAAKKTAAKKTAAKKTAAKKTGVKKALTKKAVKKAVAKKAVKKAVATKAVKKAVKKVVDKKLSVRKAAPKAKKRTK